MKHLNPRQGITTSPSPASLTSRSIWSCVKHLNPRQGITTNTQHTTYTHTHTHMCETPKSPPGDYNVSSLVSTSSSSNRTCETPKSPPGDYNSTMLLSCKSPPMKCETPKSPPGDYNSIDSTSPSSPTAYTGVKHLNPRQGITTSLTCCNLCSAYRIFVCETPKSPPGDYNMIWQEGDQTLSVRKCETPKSPPGDYNRSFWMNSFAGHLAFPSCETPKSPPGDYN